MTFRFLQIISLFVFFPWTCQPATATNFHIPADTVFVEDTIIRDVLPVDTIPDDTAMPPTHVADVPLAQEITDTIEKPLSAVPWFSEEELQNPFTLEPNYVDTTLVGFQHYDYAARGGLFYAARGNPGLAYRQLSFSPDFSPDLKTDQYKLYGDYLFRHDSLRFKRPRYVFTDLFYIMGDDREQLFYAKHAQKLHETFHLGFQYRLVNSPGTYSRHGARNANLYFTADYLSSDKRYQALASFILNRLRNQESGGLKNHTAFEENEIRDSVFMFQAESWHRDLSVNLRHFYQTGYYTEGDSVNPSRFVNLGRINHDFTYKRTAFVFEENRPPQFFYDFPRMDSLGTYDSTAVHTIKNQVSWSNFPLSSGRGSFPFNFKLFLQHSHHTIEQPYWIPEDADLFDEEGERIYYSTQENYSQWIQGAELQSDQRRFLSFGGYTNFTLGGYNDEDIHAGAFLNLGRQKSRYRLNMKLNLSSVEAPYFTNHFYGNYVRWENNFDKIQTTQLQATFTLPYLTLEGNYFLLNNMVYFDEEALPIQNSTEFGFFKFAARSFMEFGWLGMRNQAVYQYATTDNFDDFPSFMSYHSVFANFKLSNGNLINQTGIDFYYNTGYYAMSYMPVSRVFYTQDEHRMRDKLLLDVFWNAKVGNARLFVKYENILGLVFDTKPHYDIPFYPIPESMFKFGVSWMFFN